MMARIGRGILSCRLLALQVLMMAVFLPDLHPRLSSLLLLLDDEVRIGKSTFGSFSVCDATILHSIPSRRRLETSHSTSSIYTTMESISIRGGSSKRLSSPTRNSKSSTDMTKSLISTSRDKEVRGGATKSSSKNQKHTSVKGNSSSTSKVEAAWISGMKNSLASALAAASSKLLLAPLDTIKTLQQHQRATVSSAATLSLVGATKQILARPQGFLELYAGVGVAMIGSMPSVGLYFGIYSFCKTAFLEWDPDASEGRKTLYIALSAAIGNTVASGARVPYEVVKQNLQTKAYASMGDAIRQMSLRTLFPVGGIASQMLRDIPYAVVTLLTYEHLQHKWKPRAQDAFPEAPKRSWDLLVGGLAGGIGSYVTNPMDVIKTRLQTDSSIYGGSITKCVSMTLEEGGPAAFLRGSVPRLLHKVPANAFFFLFYEFFRTVLRVEEVKTTSDINAVKKR